MLGKIYNIFYRRIVYRKIGCKPNVFVAKRRDNTTLFCTSLKSYYAVNHWN